MTSEYNSLQELKEANQRLNARICELELEYVRLQKLGVLPAHPTIDEIREDFYGDVGWEPPKTFICEQRD